MSDVHVLVSPDAGRGRSAGQRADVLDRLRSHGAHVIDITGSDAVRSEANAREAVAAGATRLVVVGGDGIVHLGLQVVADTNVVLGVIPFGTGNDFVRGIAGIPDDPMAAAAIALSDGRPVDAIRAGDRWIASVATGGFSGDVNERANRLRRPRGPSRYTVATVMEVPRLRNRSTRFVIDGVAVHHETAMFAVANTAWFGGGMHIAPTAAPDDGLMDLVVAADVGRIELLRFLRLVFAGRHLDHPKVHAHRGRRIEIETDTPIALWGDGEVIGPTPRRLEAVAGAVHLARGDA